MYNYQLLVLKFSAIVRCRAQCCRIYDIFSPSSFLCGCMQAALGKVGNLNRMFEVFEDARGADKWNFMNLRQHAEHLNVRCLNAVLACIHHNQLGYGYVMLG